MYLADCMAVITPLRHHAPGGRLLDVGSGGGQPGKIALGLLGEPTQPITETLGRRLDPAVCLLGALAHRLKAFAGTLALLGDAVGHRANGTHRILRGTLHVGDIHHRCDLDLLLLGHAASLMVRKAWASSTRTSANSSSQASGSSCRRSMRANSAV